MFRVCLPHALGLGWDQMLSLGLGHGSCMSTLCVLGWVKCRAIYSSIYLSGCLLIYLYIYLSLYSYVHIYIFVCMYFSLYIYIYIYIYICVYYTLKRKRAASEIVHLVDGRLFAF